MTATLPNQENMKIVIFGASGRIGKKLTALAINQGHEVIAYDKKNEKPIFDHPRLRTVVGKLDDKIELRNDIKGVDACFSTLGGSSVMRKYPELVTGVQNIIEVMEEENISKFIYLSCLGAGESKYYIPEQVRNLLTNVMLRIPLAVHNPNEEQLAKSNLDWTVIRPGGFTNKEQTNDLKHGFEHISLKRGVSVSVSNVAAFMLEQLTKDDYVRKAVWLLE